MAEFMLHHTHRAEDCESMFQEAQKVDQSIKGRTFFCTCTSGDHGMFFQVEANSLDEALNLFPEAVRATTTVFPGKTETLP